jgi:hypothetical protein
VLFFFSLTLFVSALLLFLVQPMIGKMVLPLLGGTPAVWNTCMVFFQAILLVGYAYTHTLSTWQRPRRQLVIQAVLLFFPFLVLPFAIGNWDPSTEDNPIFRLLLLLLGMVGLPFFVVSTSAPLLQKWFGHTGHPSARDPYFLYGASNLGSMLALLAYPIVIEPNFGVDNQVRLWTAGYLVFVLLVLGCAVLLWRTAPAGPAVVAAPVAVTAGADTATAITARSRKQLALEEPPASDVDVEAISLWRRLRWIGLAAAPSSLMLGVTTYMTTDIAAVPFFWVTPLALYLATFIVVFARWPVVWTTWPHSLMLYLQPCFVLLLMLQMLASLTPRVWTTPILFALHLSAFLTTALVCHGELARDRPSPRHLTEFYLCLSIGGVLGGLFNALFAPLAFQQNIWEYPLAMVFACWLRPDLVGDKPLVPGDAVAGRQTLLGRILDLVVPLALALATWGLFHVIDSGYFPRIVTRSLILALAVVVIFMLLSRPVRFAVALLALFLTVSLYERFESTRPVFEARGFFGLIRVRAAQEVHYLGCCQPATLVGLGADPLSLLVALQPDPPDVDFAEERIYHTLIHGGINHGRQIVYPPQRRTEPITYFHPTNGIGEVFAKFSWPNARLGASLAGMGADSMGVLLDLKFSEPPYAVIGLGTGTLAAHARPLQQLDFYEIDPLVRRLSLPPAGEQPVFYFVHDALERGARVDMIMGDGRLQLAKAPAQHYHSITVDAFSSDAIPVHLLTKEAVQLYLDKLADGGTIIFNATNRYVDIRGVLAAIARDLDLDCLYCGDYASQSIPDKYAADWVVLARKSDAVPLRRRLSSRWEEIEPLSGPAWSDNYSNLFRVMNWR